MRRIIKQVPKSCTDVKLPVALFNKTNKWLTAVLATKISSLSGVDRPKTGDQFWYDTVAYSIGVLDGEYVKLIKLRDTKSVLEPLKEWDVA